MTSFNSLKCSEIPSHPAIDIKQHQLPEPLMPGTFDSVVDFGIYATYQYTHTANMLIRAAGCDELELPLFKMLRGVCKIFMLNEIEIVVWYLLNRHSSWGRQFKMLKVAAFHNFVDFLQITTVENVPKYKRTLLFVCLTAYFVKQTMQTPDSSKAIKAIVPQVSQFIKLQNFEKLYASIHPNLQELYDKFTLALINQTYSELLVRKLKLDDNQMMTMEDDYNQIVDQILDMAPPYQKEDVKPSKKVTRMKKGTAKREPPPQIPPPAPQVDDYFQPGSQYWNWNVLSVLRNSGSNLSDMLRISEPTSFDFVRKLQHKN